MVRIAAAVMVGVLALVGLFGRAEAAPDPVVASTISAASTVVPLAASGGLLFTGRGKDEKIRYDFGIGFLALGSIFGPSAGQVYAEGGSEAVVVFVLRALTGTLMTVGAGVALRSTDSADAGRALFVVGAIPTAFLAGWDIVGAASSAREAKYRDRMAALDAEKSGLVSLVLCGPIPCGI